MIGQRNVRYAIGVTVMVAHFVAITMFLTVGYTAFAGDLAKCIQGVATLAPVSAIYVSAFLNYVLRYPTPAPDEVTGQQQYRAFFVQYGLVLLFCLTLIAIPAYIFASSDLPSDYATIAAGAVDTIFGVYVALIFKQLFPD